ncbi:MAG TPA: hypothetical protein VMT30_07465 [Candidatus Saccharimonadia bacterium]|nr:hypothetical protein [Candidatus Saccharimonadia bacterium]
MKFASATPPTPLKTAILRRLSYALAIFTAILAATQIASWSDFASIFQTYQLASAPASAILAGSVIGLELLSLPFLCRLPLSRGLRRASASAFVSLPYLWTYLATSAIFRDLAVSNYGLFGTLIPIGTWQLALAIELLWMTLVGLTFGAFGGRKALKLK